jgi:hypothetical protein
MFHRNAAWAGDAQKHTADNKSNKCKADIDLVPGIVWACKQRKDFASMREVLIR